MVRSAVVVALLAWAGAAGAADKLQYGPPPVWVVQLPLPTDAKSPAGVAAQILLWDGQQRYSDRADQFYQEAAIRIVSAQALGLLSSISRAWNPDTQSLTINKLRIIRGDQVIDLLGGGKTMTVLRRETNLDAAMIDGTLTATLQPEDLRVGDIVDIATTTDTADPVLKGMSQGAFAIPSVGAVARVHFSALWAPGKPIIWRATEGAPAPTLARTPVEDRLALDLRNFELPKPPMGAPARYSALGQIEVTQFHDWAQVSALMAPLYRAAETVNPGSELDQEISKIAHGSSDPKTRAAAALQLVQEKVRYLAVTLDNGELTPANAEVTWARRFGDCKAKTALLLAILSRLGIDAEPALVSTNLGDGLNERLPRIDIFNHVLVRTEIGGKTYWLDGVRVGDEDLDHIQIPAFHWALPVKSSGAALEALTQPPLDQPERELTVNFDATNGLDAPAPAHLEETFRNDTAVAEHLAIDTSNAADRDRSLREFWTQLYPRVTVSAVTATYDASNKTMRFTMDGAADIDWTPSGTTRRFWIPESQLGWDASFKREPGPDQDAPFAVNHPSYEVTHVSVRLPKHGYHFLLANAEDLDATIAGVEYHRRSRLTENGAVMTVSTRSIAREFPAALASAAASALHNLWLTEVAIDGDPRQDATLPAANGDLPPASAQEFEARGVTELAARDFDRAVSDFTVAVEREPASAQYRYNRGVANFEKGDQTAALADFSEAQKLKPSDVLAVSALGEVSLAMGDEGAARAAFDKAAAIDPGRSYALKRAADAFAKAHRYETAIHYIDLLIARFPGDTQYPDMLSARCQAKAALGRDLEGGLTDCMATLKLKPQSANGLGARGFVELRMGNWRAAKADYDAALAIRGDDADDLFGRGIVEKRMGDADAAGSDFKAAEAVDPAIAGSFKRDGVSP